MENIRIGLNLLEMTSFDGKNFFLNGIVLYYYAPIANAILYKLIHLAFVVLKDTFYLSIILYKSFARTCLFATKSIFQAE